MRTLGLGDVGDLLAYRQMWEPFIAAHLELWRYVNGLLESTPTAQKCPTGIFNATQIQNMDATERGFCASLVISRMYTSDTNPLGILPQWNAWKGKSSAEILTGAGSMLEWHQDVVMRVGGPYKDELIKIAKLWGIEVRLPELPSFSKQQEIIARIEGAYVSVKGALQVIGYGVNETLVKAGDVTSAVAEGLTEIPRAAAKAVSSPFVWIGVTAVLAVVGGALLIYYAPRKPVHEA
ncbi:MAG: hypothetical protein EHM89_05615 [Acidobacteria bacterium]|nr:MAG: hypothetical protein EHM89_05615 [Acidobacteriota bacterium]